MKAMLGWLAVFGGGIAAGSIAALVVTGGRPATNMTPSETVPGVAPAAASGDAGSGDNPYGAFRFGAFDLVDQSGVARGPEVFDGAVTVVTFFFSNCVGPCPAIAMVMGDIQARTEGEGLRLASISVDGERDDPAALRAYSARIGADADRWRFLTGDPAEVGRLARESLGYDLRIDTSVTLKTGDGRTMANILHPTRLLLIGPDRRAIGVYAYQDAKAIDRMLVDARAALAAIASGD